MGYRITTDSTADLPQSFLKERDIPCVGLSFMLEGQQYTEGPDVTITMPEFYDKLRAGVPATTMQVNAFEFTSFVEPFLAAGEDVLHVAFSSGLSGTYASCASAAEELPSIPIASWWWWIRWRHRWAKDCWCTMPMKTAKQA